MKGIGTLFFPLLALTVPLAQPQTVVSKADLDAKFAQAPQEVTVPESSCCSIRFEAFERKPRPRETEDGALMTLKSAVTGSGGRGLTAARPCAQAHSRVGLMGRRR
jgi:hypothetical protein